MAGPCGIRACIVCGALLPKTTYHDHEMNWIAVGERLITSARAQSASFYAQSVPTMEKCTLTPEQDTSARKLFGGVC